MNFEKKRLNRVLASRQVGLLHNIGNTEYYKFGGGLFTLDELFNARVRFMEFKEKKS